MPKAEIPRIGRLRLAPEFRDFIRRRTLPFLHDGSDRSLETLLGEAYVQGVRDALSAPSHAS